MSFLLDKLFQKQNPELASQMAKRGLVFDRIRHRWVRNPENRANPTTAPTSIKPEGLTSSGKDLMLDPITGKPAQMSQDEKLNVWNQLNSGDTVKVWSEEVMSFGSPKWKEFKVGRKSKSKKYDVEKITLQNPTNPKGVKHFFYNRQGRISFVSGDLGTNLIAMKKVQPQTAPTGIPKKGGKWKIGKYVPHDETLYEYRVGSNVGWALIPEATEGMASIAGVGFDGKIITWLMRHEPVEEALKFIKEREKIDSYDKD